MPQIKTVEVIPREMMEGGTDTEVTEFANKYAEKCKQAAKVTVIEAIQSGHALNIMKDRVPHGEWTAWLGANWDYDARTARTYMTLSANWKRFRFENGTSIREAMRQIADDSAEKDPDQPIVPRSERKPADVKVSIPDDDGDPDADQVDDDPAPDPPTIRKTAKGSEKVPEDKKPKTAAIVPEIVDEPKETFPKAYLQDPAPRDDSEIISEWLEEAGLPEVLERWLGISPTDKVKKEAARLMRKQADKLDPPKNGTIPTVEEVAEYAAEKGWIGFNAEKFWNHYDLADWKYGKAKTPLKKWKTAAASAWENGHGWASSTQNGKAQNNGHSNGRTDGSCLGVNGRPEVQKRKIIYK